MRFSEHIDFAGDRSHGSVITAVDAWLTGQDAASHDALFKTLEHIFHVVCRRTALCCQLGQHLIPYLTDLLVASGFLSGTICLTEWSLRSSLYGAH